jgi:hypothetical protein
MVSGLLTNPDRRTPLVAGSGRLVSRKRRRPFSRRPALRGPQREDRVMITRCKKALGGVAYCFSTEAATDAALSAT